MGQKVGKSRFNYFAVVSGEDYPEITLAEFTHNLSADTAGIAEIAEIKIFSSDYCNRFEISVALADCLEKGSSFSAVCGAEG